MVVTEEWAELAGAGESRQNWWQVWGPRAQHPASFYCQPQSTEISSQAVFSSEFDWGFLAGSVVKNLPADAGDTSLIPDPWRSHMPRDS